MISLLVCWSVGSWLVGWPHLLAGWFFDCLAFFFFFFFFFVCLFGVVVFLFVCFVFFLLLLFVLFLSPYPDKSCLTPTKDDEPEDNL